MPDNNLHSTYFIGPGRGANAKSELLTISSNPLITSRDGICENVTIPDYPLGERSGYNMEVISEIYHDIIVLS